MESGRKIQNFVILTPCLKKINFPEVFEMYVYLVVAKWVSNDTAIVVALPTIMKWTKMHQV